MEKEADYKGPHVIQDEKKRLQGISDKSVSFVSSPQCGTCCFDNWQDPIETWGHLDREEKVVHINDHSKVKKGKFLRDLTRASLVMSLLKATPWMVPPWNKVTKMQDICRLRTIK